MACILALAATLLVWWLFDRFSVESSNTSTETRHCSKEAHCQSQAAPRPTASRTLGSRRILDSDAMSPNHASDENHSTSYEDGCHILTGHYDYEEDPDSDYNQELRASSMEAAAEARAFEMDLRDAAEAGMDDGPEY